MSCCLLYQQNPLFTFFCWLHCCYVSLGMKTNFVRRKFMKNNFSLEIVRLPLCIGKWAHWKHLNAFDAQKNERFHNFRWWYLLLFGNANSKWTHWNLEIQNELSNLFNCFLSASNQSWIQIIFNKWLLQKLHTWNCVWRDLMFYMFSGFGVARFIMSMIWASPA